uniref:Uncharacterized protein n=1 Tax=Arsenophonus endosymbiont of Trialeurodes vaporariorum TaxID=235567 RepID=A0A3B0MMY5_9GAMM
MDRVKLPKFWNILHPCEGRNYYGMEGNLPSLMSNAAISIMHLEAFFEFRSGFSELGIGCPKNDWT